VHQGCTRNEYHEYDLEDNQLGGRGCLFFNLGCQGPKPSPTATASCGTAQQQAPRRGALLRLHLARLPATATCSAPKIGAVPKLPLGVSRAQYMAYKNLAHAAAPKRGQDRDMEP
jgi:hydrogenase small subunit